MACACVMLGACAAASKLSVRKTEPAHVTLQSVDVPVCPAEVTATVSPAPAVPDGAIIKANDAGNSWLSAMVEYGKGLADRLMDAQAACPKAASKEQQ